MCNMYKDIEVTDVSQKVFTFIYIYFSLTINNKKVIKKTFRKSRH